MRKLLFLFSSVLLFSCEKDDIEPMIVSPKVETIPTKPIEYRYDTLTSNEIRGLSDSWHNYHGKGLATYADLNNDGEEDVIYIDEGIFIRIYKNGAYQSQKVEGVSFIFARSVIPFDANGDRYIDFVVLAHNDERIQPNPGEVPYLFMNNEGKGFTPIKMNVKQDFWHLGTAGDLDGDKDNDLVICTAGSVTYLRNDGGKFVEIPNVVPESYKVSHYVGALIDDFNEDGFNDLLFYGHEYAIFENKNQIAKTRILFGNKAGIFNEDYSISIQEERDGFGVIIDAVSFDLNKDGIKEI
ncbi:VCBS repeat-containing protein, partial [archaeon]|nr:VCBS repeat-containing protein [archaeon]